MTYTVICVVFLSVSIVIALLSVQRSDRQPTWVAVGISAGALVVLTIVFDNLMIAAGLFDYGHGRVAGWYVGRVPLEDLAYPLAGVVALPALWTALRARRSRPPLPTAASHTTNVANRGGLAKLPHTVTEDELADPTQTPAHQDQAGDQP